MCVVSWSWVVLALALSPLQARALCFDHPGLVLFGERWGTREDATKAGFVAYGNRYYPAKLLPKLRAWEREDQKGDAGGDTYSMKSKPQYTALHYALGWSFLHFLIHTEQGKYGKQFGAVLKRLNGSDTRPFGEVFREIYGEGLAVAPGAHELLVGLSGAGSAAAL